MNSNSLYPLFNPFYDCAYLACRQIKPVKEGINKFSMPYGNLLIQGMKALLILWIVYNNIHMPDPFTYSLNLMTEIHLKFASLNAQTCEQ